MHRIKGLSEKFIYFNDDMLLTSPVKPTDFFVKDKICDAAVINPIIGTIPGHPFVHYLLNNIELINGHFNLHDVIRKNYKNWFSLKYGRKIIHNIYFSRLNKFVGFTNFHMPAPMLKSTFEDVWSLETELLDKTCCNRFRGLNDVNPYVMTYYAFCSNKFIAKSPKYGKYLDLSNDMSKLIMLLKSQKYKYITINDSDGVKDFEVSKQICIDSLAKFYSQKSSFEK